MQIKGGCCADRSRKRNRLSLFSSLRSERLGHSVCHSDSLLPFPAQIWQAGASCVNSYSHCKYHGSLNLQSLCIQGMKLASFSSHPLHGLPQTQATQNSEESAP